MLIKNGTVLTVTKGTLTETDVLVKDGKVAQRLKADTVANTGVSAAAFAERLELFKHATILSTAEEVRELQSRKEE